MIPKSEANSMYGCVFPNARQCRARSKRTGLRCRAPAVGGCDVCRFHGAGGGQPQGEKNSAYRHGFYSDEEIRSRRAYVKMMKMVLSQLKGFA